MTATYTEPVLNYTIPLDFRHRLSTVEVRIERNEGVREAAIECETHEPFQPAYR